MSGHVTGVLFYCFAFLSKGVPVYNVLCKGVPVYNGGTCIIMYCVSCCYTSNIDYITEGPSFSAAFSWL